MNRRPLSALDQATSRYRSNTGKGGSIRSVESQWAGTGRLRGIRSVSLAVGGSARSVAPPWVGARPLRREHIAAVGGSVEDVALP